MAINFFAVELTSLCSTLSKPSIGITVEIHKPHHTWDIIYKNLREFKLTAAPTPVSAPAPVIVIHPPHFVTPTRCYPTIVPVELLEQTALYELRWFERQV